MRFQTSDDDYIFRDGVDDDSHALVELRCLAADLRRISAPFQQAYMRRHRRN